MPEETSTETFELAYDGPALREGRMDVRDLGPALVSVGDLLERANTVLNGTEAKVSVQVRADFRRGSFQILLDALQSFPSDVLTKDSLTNAKLLLEVLGLGGSGALGLIGFIKWLRGRQPDKVERTPNKTVRVQIEDRHVEIHHAVFNLFSDGAVRKDAQGIVEPLRSQGVERFEIRRDGKVIESVERSDLPYFVSEEKEQDPTIDTTSEEVLEVVKPSFREDLRWSLWTLDGQRVGVNMLDQDFLKRVDSGEIAFRKGDLLRVTVRTKAWKVKGQWRVERDVLKVIDHFHPAESGNLFS